MMKWIIIVCGLIGLILRMEVAMFPYSGEGKPPMFGDYEAQRHWMEVTLNLPLREWYLHTTRNDLNYWGLDYPPLTAYHSYLIGRIVGLVLPESVALGTSRGFESPLHKFVMRCSVIASDLLLPALLFFHFIIKPYKVKTGWATVLLAVTAPPLILIDYGHFQYNCVSLGLTVWAIMALLNEKISLSAILFTLAVNHKQMSLYHAITFFCYMFGTVIIKRADFFTGFRVGTTILSTLGLLWLPFAERSVNVINRIFPVKRGVFEDKVGSFWYVLDRFIPIKATIPGEEQAKTCMVVCISMLLPSALQFLTKISTTKTSVEETRKAFLVNLFVSSLIFFLFSYHVHEKSIMLATLAGVLLLQWYPFEMVWFITAASLSLFPLLYQEGSHVALLLVTAIFILTAHQGGVFRSVKSSLARLAFLVSISGYIALISGLVFLPGALQKYPHLFQAGIAIYSFAHYAAFLIYFHFPNPVQDA